MWEENIGFFYYLRVSKAFLNMKYNPEALLKIAWFESIKTSARKNTSTKSNDKHPLRNDRYPLQEAICDSYYISYIKEQRVRGLFFQNVMNAFSTNDNS